MRILTGDINSKRIREYLRQETIQKKLEILADSEIKIEVLNKGKFNIMHLIVIENKKFILRINTHTPHNLTNKTQKEFEILKYIQDTGLAPKPILFDDDNTFEIKSLLLGFIEGCEIKEQDLTKKNLTKIAKIYSKIHSIKFNKYGEFPPKISPPFSLCKELLDYYTQYNLEPLIKDVKSKAIINQFVFVLKKVLDILKQQDKNYSNITEFCLLKGDNKLSNIIINKKHPDNPLKFIDWEFSKVGIKMMDIANFISFAKLNREQTKHFIKEYSQYQPTPSHHNKTKISESLLKIFLLRDFVLRSIWTLNKASEFYNMGNQPAFEQELRILKTKISKIPKYL